MSAIDVQAPVVEVLVLEDRARVTRRGKVHVPAGQSRLIVVGAAPVLVDKTLIATCDGATVVDVRCKRALAPWQTGEPAAGDVASRAAAAEALATEVRAAEAHAARLEVDVDVLDRELADVARLGEVALTELASEAAWGRPPGVAVDRLARLDARDAELAAAATTARLQLERARRDLEALKTRASDAANDAGVDRAEIVVDVVAQTAGERTLVLEYLVPGACWRPYHTATLDGGHVTIATDACVWQNTGEDWRDVALACSTERPSLGAAPPTLVSDEVRIQRKSDAVVVETREQEIEDTGLGVERAQQTAAVVPGVDDGGVTQVLRAPHAATIHADGRPYRVRLGDHTAPAEVALVAFPERSPCAFTRVRFANGPRPLLAGPVDLIRDRGHVGRTSILYVAPSEKLELGFGPDAELRLHREHRRHRDDAGVLGSWNESRIRVAVRVSNLGRAARTLEVTERIPVSEIDKVEIKLAPPDAWQLEDDDGERRDDTPVVTARVVDAADGLVTWTVELPARDRRAVALQYTIRAHTSVVGI